MVHFWDLDYAVAPLDLIALTMRGCEYVGADWRGSTTGGAPLGSFIGTAPGMYDSYVPTRHAYACTAPGEPMKLMAR